ncbi:helix-turn-helix domain-containing protein [Caldifermentibacillus hisashii]|uniref:helix-turn-helix domain-containing protein n=1 Tax=Caldifermentibacillus hisashii TaxID=996558 RepID=UPI0034D6C1BC
MAAIISFVKSQHSLINTDESILSIALEHGFKNISSYNRLFMKMYRKTPTEFRKIYRRK